jgi:hypothetical protein
MAGLVGTDPYLTLNAKDVVFQFNGAFAAGYPIPMVYADFSSIQSGGHTGLDIPIGSNPAGMNINFDSNFLRVGMTANLGVFNLFTLSTHFDFTFKLPSSGSLIPTIDLSSLKNLLPEISPSAPDWLKGAMSLIKNINLSISVDGILGDIEIPDMNISLGNFVYIHGDFKLSLGVTFTADAATGLDPLLGKVADIAIKAAASAIVPGLPADKVMKYLLNVSDDYSVIHDVKFKGVSFGASDVNIFVGSGPPDFSKPLASQSSLVGFGLQNLDLAIGVFTPQLPKYFNAQSVTSIYAKADEMGG